MQMKVDWLPALRTKDQRTEQFWLDWIFPEHIDPVAIQGPAFSSHLSNTRPPPPHRTPHPHPGVVDAEIKDPCAKNLVGQLVVALSPVNNNGLYQDWGRLS